MILLMPITLMYWLSQSLELLPQWGDHSDGKGGLGRGVGMYVHDSLNHSACPMLENGSFDCSTWSVIKLRDNKSLLLGAVYRSPNSSADTVDVVYTWKYGGPHILNIICAIKMKLCVYNAHVL